MLLRKNFFPRTISDGCVTLFTVFIVPYVYYFELFVVLPHYYIQWEAWYCFHFVTGTFILFNIISNYLGILICDTSIRGRILPTTLKDNNRFCAVCECIAPARSWHCDVCNVCILKRDHHCMFTGCCIGYYNCRYFLMFLLYICIATIYASYYNVYFVFEFTNFSTWENIIRVVFPLATLFMEFSLKQMYNFVAVIIIIGCIFTGVLFYYHCDLIMKGMITHEKRLKLSPYDLGRKPNIQAALGKRWYLIWVSPFVESELPGDGIHWKVKQSHKAK